MSVVTRFAPSPTGYLHIGGLRTALYAFLHARHNAGKFLLRIEDTDQTRFVPGSLESLIRTLTLCGLNYDEGPYLNEAGEVRENGEHGPYIQSMRLPKYQAAAKELIEAGHAYYCFCSKDRLETLRNQQTLAKTTTKYDRLCTHLSKEEVAQKLDAGEPHVVRMLVPEGKTTFNDVIRGSITFDHNEVDDQVILKTDGFPTYHLAVVVDDSDMQITHVVRGEEWLSSTPKHLILYNMLGLKAPEMAHLPLILNPDRSKLSKRQGDVSVEDFVDKGYLPEALVNFVALVGWNPKGDQEIYTFEEMIELFDLSKVNKAGGVFNREKLDWMNAQYIKALSPEEVVKRITPFIKRADLKVPSEDLLLRAVTVEKERLVTLADMNDKLAMYTVEQSLEDYLMLVWKKSTKEETIQILSDLINCIQNLEDDSFLSVSVIEEKIKSYISEAGLQNGPVLWPMRVALSGAAQSPSPFELAWVLQKTETIKRLTSARNNLQK